MSESKYFYVSKKIEPAITHLLGVSGMKLIEARDNYLERGDEDYILWYAFANQVQAHWYMVNEALGSLSAAIAGGGAQHFSVAMQNEQLNTARFIKDLCGVCPIQQKEEFQLRGNYNFEHLKEEAK